jgi:hypothetical protein
MKPARSINRLCVAISIPLPIFTMQNNGRRASMMMRTLITTAAVTAALAAPALSQTRSQVQPYDPSVYGRDLSGYGSYGTYTRFRDQRPIYGRGNVYDQRGNYLGTDPDPRVRDQMRRDPSQGD